MTTASQRTRLYFEKLGYRIELVERYIHYARVRKDFLGCIDYLAIKEGCPIIGIQSFTTAWGQHKKKILDDHFIADNVKFWLSVGNTEYWFIGWRKLKLKRKGKAIRWVPKFGHITLKPKRRKLLLTQKMEFEQNMAKHNLIFVKWGKKVISLNDVQKITKKTAAQIGYYYRQYDCRTKKDFLNVIAKMEAKRKSVSAKKYNFRTGLKTIADYIDEDHPEKKSVNYQMIKQRILKYGAKSPCIDFPKLSQAEFRRRLGLPELNRSFPKRSKPINFDKTKFCFKKGIKCRHYSSCLEIRAFENSHHKRYKKSGKCYEIYNNFCSN